MKVYKKQEVFIETLQLPLLGNYQTRNLPGVLVTVDHLTALGITIEKNTLIQGLERVILQTGLKGRWQILGESPLTICDTGHNEDGVKQVMDQIREQSYQKLHIVWGVVKDKDITNILKLLPKQASYYFCQAKIPRAMDAAALAEKANAFGLKGRAFADVNEAKQAAMNEANKNDLIFIGGSTFVVAELNEL
jgi:dihydrofolate synthase / folylpolyglutamate synthase